MDVIPWWQRPRVVMSVALVVLVAGVALMIGVARSPDMRRWLDVVAVVLMAASSSLVIVVRGRSRTLRRQSNTLHRQEAVLRATAVAAERFAEVDLHHAIASVLGELGEAAGASRVYVYRNELDEHGQLAMSQLHEWVARGIDPTIDDPENQRYAYEAGFDHWSSALSRGEPVHTLRSQASGTELLDMEAESIMSCVVTPIFVSGSWWGFLGFDDCARERVWSAAELDALKVAAGTLGSAIARERARVVAAEAEQRYRTLVEQSPAVVYIDGLDDVASTVYISPQVERVLGYSAEEWMADDQLWPRLLHDDDRAEALAAVAKHNETGEPFRMEYRLTAKDGRTVWIRDDAVMVKGEDGSFQYSQGIMQDVTDVKEAEAQIAFLAYHDRLTGLPNLPMLVEVGEMAIARAKRQGEAAAVLFVDVDGFKLANDSLGSEIGDQLLGIVAERITSAIRDTDTLARRGGDEFVVLLADLERGEVGDMQAPLLFAESVAGRIRSAMDDPIQIDGNELFLSVSVGISVHPDDADDLQQLLHHAEAAMFSSKSSGPGGFAASTVGAVDSATKLAFVTKLRKAVDREEWELHYQPIVQLATQSLVGVEGLLRWRTPDGELIPPNEFIPLAEELGLIETMGDWVVEEMMRQDRLWREVGIDLEMGFNLSPRQFWQPDLAERILCRLEAERADPGRVMVEITESSAMRDPDRAHAVLWDLHARGLRVAIDDFGTGYSSLSRLRHLPIDVLKIDRSFVSAVDTDPQAATIVSAFIQLGQGLGMATLAEGIETEGEWRFLAERGCELGQGFYFSRPVPAAELTARFAAGEIAVAR